MIRNYYLNLLWDVNMSNLSLGSPIWVIIFNMNCTVSKLNEILFLILPSSLQCSSDWQHSYPLQLPGSRQTERRGARPSGHNECHRTAVCDNQTTFYKHMDSSLCLQIQKLLTYWDLFWVWLKKQHRQIRNSVLTDKTNLKIPFAGNLNILHWE